MDLRQHLEHQAEPVIERLIEGEIQAGIMSCIARGSNSVAIDLPAAVVTTAAFDRLQRWMDAQGLSSVVAEFNTDVHDAIHARLSIQPKLFT